MTHKTRGLVLLAAGIFFPLLFLYGGGFMSGEGRGRIAMLFGVVYVLSMLINGFLLRRWRPPALSEVKRTSLIQHVAGYALFLMMMFLSRQFFESRAFATSLGQHAFVIFVAAGISMFIPLGIYSLRAHRASPQA